MPCDDCQRYDPLPLDRKSITKRIKESRTLKKRLTMITEDRDRGIALFRCPVCEETWQSGREWHFANAEYLFRVPSITIEDWQQEHYRQPAAMMLYTARMTDFVAKLKQENSADRCRTDGCPHQALARSVFCMDHHIESLQESGMLPGPPSGRLFPPYVERRSDP